MKVRFVLCHPVNDVSGEERQVFLADGLLARGHDAAVYVISPQDISVTRRFRKYSCDVRYFLADDIRESPHRAASAEMLNQLKEDMPDLVVVKGIDYAQSRRIFEIFSPDRIAVIIGGVSKHQLLDRCRIVYFENQQQLALYNGPATSCVLPKWIQWEHVQPHGANGIDYDIINVGNFDEDRKAQELLLPFVLKYRVAFIGGGRRLESFRSICRDRKNVTFSGFVRHNELFDYLSRSRLMVHSSIWDGYPRAVAEGLAAGVPVVGVQGVLDGITEKPIIRCAPIERLHGLVFSALDSGEELEGLSREASDFMTLSSSPQVVLDTFCGPIEVPSFLA